MKSLIELGAKIEQIAFNVIMPWQAKYIKDVIGGDWHEDAVKAQLITLFGKPCNGTNEAVLMFNYDFVQGKELEIIRYQAGPNWLAGKGFGLSHLGLHVDDFSPIREKLEDEDIQVAQEVITISHTNPNVPSNRRYHYLIFNTREIFGFDLKLIKRLTV